MEVPKLKAVKVYQAVEFQRKLESFFIDNKSKKMEDLEMTTNLIGVEIKTNKDHIIVPYANIAAMYPADSNKIKSHMEKPLITREGSAIEVAEQAAKDEEQQKLDAAAEIEAAKELELSKEENKARAKKVREEWKKKNLDQPASAHVFQENDE